MFESITDSLGNIFDRLRGQRRLSEEVIREAMREVRLVLLEADVSQQVVGGFIKRITEQAVGEEIIKSVKPGDMVIKIVHDELVRLLGSETSELNLTTTGSAVIMFCGLQGSGKTTSVGKLATRLLSEGRKPLLVAADVQRPAAIEQLKILGEQVGVPVYAEESGDPVVICKRSIKVAEVHHADVIILDTAGRLHVDEDLMVELEQIVKGVSPHEVLLVLDAMTGQDAVHSAEAFAGRLPLTGAILTKMDGDARGGAALSLREVSGVPIKFVGVGEKLSELEQFHPERMAGRILGMGDIVSLVEKAQATVDEKEQLEMQEKLLSNTFTLEDFKKQLAQIRKIGSIKDLLGMIPGIGRQVKGIDVDDGEFRKIETIIGSMTKEERQNAELIGSSRSERIARGSGTSIAAVNKLLKQFRQMRKMIGKMGSSGMFSGLADGAMPAMSGAGLRPPASGGSGLQSRKDKRKARKKDKRNKRKRRK
ncbi:MAG: signal recognition particle protein [Planctomycetes bacterium]|nr:signal recognition particle protein [Planctomycetota bacterium]